MDVAQVKYETLSGRKQILGDAHNIWLNVAGQTGLFGLAALMLMMIFLLKRSRFRLIKGDEGHCLRVGLSCAFIGAFVYQGLAGSFEDARHLWVLIIGVSVDFSSSESDISPASKTL